LGFGVAILVLAAASAGVVLWNRTAEPNGGPGPLSTTVPTSTPPRDGLGGTNGWHDAGGGGCDELRAAGFLAYDYRVCSNSVREPGVLRQGKETRTAAVLVGKEGEITTGAKAAPPAALDVLITSGDPCNR
jgi:hypothetical protein